MNIGCCFYRERKNPPTLQKDVPPTFYNNAYRATAEGLCTLLRDVIGFIVLMLVERGKGNKIYRIAQMEIAEIVRIGRELLKLLSENEVRVEDWKYLNMYDEYRRMRKNGVKYRFAVAELATLHHISRAKVERIISRLQKNVK